MKIYTKTGDDGTTSLFGGRRVKKHALRIAAYGAVDELNALLGLAISSVADSRLRELLNRVQNDLFVLGADLATPMDHHSSAIERIGETDVPWLEEAIDELDGALPPIRFFILPGGSESASRLHVCRAVCRRAERNATELADSEPMNENVIRYLNRLSDFLFVLARYANAACGVEEVPWKRK
jgi:cob(I)alamin adenosyltransferase